MLSKNQAEIMRKTWKLTKIDDDGDFVVEHLLQFFAINFLDDSFVFFFGSNDPTENSILIL